MRRIDKHDGTGLQRQASSFSTINNFKDKPVRIGEDKRHSCRRRHRRSTEAFPVGRMRTVTTTRSPSHLTTL